MHLIPGITTEQEEEVLSIWQQFPSAKSKAEAILQLIGFSLSPTFTLHSPKPETPEMKADVQRAVQSATDCSFDVVAIPLAEIAEWRFNHFEVYLDVDEAYRRISYEFMNAYHRCAEVIAGTDSSFVIKDWFQLRDTPPREWERLDQQLNQRSLKNLWNAMTLAFHGTLTRAVGHILYGDTPHKDVRPLLNLYKTGIFPFGIGGKDIPEADANKRQQYVLTLCDKE